MSDHIATRELALPPSNHGDRHLRTDLRPTSDSLYAEASWNSNRVQIDTLDSFNLDFTTVGAIWMDVRDTRLRYLLAPELLGSAMPIVAEYSPHFLVRAGALDRFHDVLADTLHW